MRTLRAITFHALCVLVAVSLASAEAPPEARGRFFEILRLNGEGAYARALEDAKQLASEHRDFETVHRTIVDLYLLLGDIDAARSYFEGRIEHDSQNAYAYYGLGRIDFHEGDFDGAIEKLKRAILLEPNFAEPFGLRGGLPGVYEAKKDLDAAIAYFETLTVSSPDNANAFSGLGWSYARSFQVDKAIPAFMNALEINPGHIQSYHGLVQSYSRTGRYQKSMESCQALNEAATRSGDFEMLAYAGMMQGTIAFRKGDYRTALVHLHESQRLAQEIGDVRREASSVNNAAAVYATAGDYEKALEYFEMSLEPARRTGNTQTEVHALINIGSVHRESDRFEVAITNYREAVTLARDAGFRNQQSLALANMAEAFHRRGDLDDALHYYNQAVEIAEETQNRTIEAFVAGSLGGLSRDRGSYAEAIAYFERQLAIGEQTGEAQPIWEAEAGLGSTYERRGDVDNAIAHYAKAIARYDAVRESLAIESIGSSFLEDKYQAYPSIVQLLAGQGELEEAFAYAEKYKAKGFLDILARGHTLFETHLPEALRLELDQIRAELQESHAELSRERSLTTRDPTTTVMLEERVTELELRKSALVDRVREEHGEFYQLALSEPLDVSSIQSKVLEPGQFLVEYLMGEEKLSIFVVSRDELHYREVPVGRNELRQRLSELSPLFAADEPRGRLFNSELADFSLPPARVLYETLLEPVEEWLPENAELIIVPDDFLFYLPFEVLVAESEDAEHRYDFSAATFVVERYAVSYSPSASLLDPGLRRPRRFEKGVLAFGNPAFGDTVDDQPPLPNSEAEVEAIGDAFGGYDNGIFTGDEVTEAVFAREAADYGVLHFATHFLIDDRQPLYSRIVLAADDVLQTYEIFDAELNAELAVLSACNTGLGKLEKGEGLIGISRAFLYAGVPSLVVSLWSVDDEATARIMELFYGHLRSGASKKQALRQAKLDYLSDARGNKKDPFYWAPFILSGDWRPLALPDPRRSEPAWLVPATVLLFGAGALLVWKRRRSPS